MQDDGALVAGAYAALSPIQVSTTSKRGAIGADRAGVLLVTAALFSLVMSGMVATGWFTVLFGVRLFIPHGSSPTPNVWAPRGRRG